ncbi:MAG: preprotein translocase subunit YajC [Candidatus Coproplasma sp.]
MLFSLLADDTTNANNWVSYVLIGVLVVILVVSMIIMNRRSKKREKEAQDLIDAVKPGNKVTTIGGIVGIVVEVNPDDNTIVVETGSEVSGKSYIKFIRQAIYESDAVVDKKASDAKTVTVTEEATAPVEEVVEEAPVTPVETTVEETAPVEEVKEEEAAPVEEVKPKKTSKKSKKNN